MGQPSPIQRAACHCGKVAIEVLGPPPTRVYECNCSICTKKAYLHWFVPRDRVRLHVQDGALSTYIFNTGRARHHYCAACGVAPFYVARSHPDDYDVNARCVEGLDIAGLDIVPFDGRNWERAVEELCAEKSPL